MSAVSSGVFNGKVVSNFILIHPHVGKPECSVIFQFQDGTEIVLKSESVITIEEKPIKDEARVTDVIQLGGSIKHE